MYKICCATKLEIKRTTSNILDNTHNSDFDDQVIIQNTTKTTTRGTNINFTNFTEPFDHIELDRKCFACKVINPVI